MFDEALKALKLRGRIMELSRGCMGRYSNTIIVFGIVWKSMVYGGIFKYNRPIKLMCQLWGEFIEIYVKTDLWSFQKVPSGYKGKTVQRNIVSKALSQ